MPLTNDEFARMDVARVNSLHLRQKGSGKRVLQLAFEHLEDLQKQQQTAIRTIERLVDLRAKSLCYRVPRFFAVLWARIKVFVAKGALWLP